MKRAWNAPGVGEFDAGFEEEFELPVVQYVLVGVLGGGCASMPFRPARRPVVVALHPEPIDEARLGCMLNPQSVIGMSAEFIAHMLQGLVYKISSRGVRCVGSGSSKASRGHL